MRPETAQTLARRVRSWNEQLDEKGLCVRVLKGCMRTHQYLVYVYRESRLRVLLAQPQVRDFLRGEGYDLPQQPGRRCAVAAAAVPEALL